MSSPNGKLLDFPLPEEASVRWLGGIMVTPAVDAKVKQVVAECHEAYKAILAEGRKNGHIIDPKKEKG